MEKQSQAGFATSGAPYMKPLNLPKTVGRYCTNYVDRRFQALHLFARDQQVFGIPAFPALPNHGGGRDVVILTVKRNVSEYSGQYTCGFLSVQPSPRGMFVNSLWVQLGATSILGARIVYSILSSSARNSVFRIRHIRLAKFQTLGQASVEDPTLIFSISWKTTEISGRGASGL